MRRAELSQRSVSPDQRSRNGGGAGAKSIYGNVKSGAAALSSAPGAVRFRSTSRAIPVALPAVDVRCLVSRADGTAGAGLIDCGDSRRGMLVITGGKNGALHIRSAITGAIDGTRVSNCGASGELSLVHSADGSGDVGAARVGTTVTALCLGPGNKLWCGYNDGTMRVYGVDARAKLLGDDTIVSGGLGGSGGGSGGHRRNSSPRDGASVVSSGRNSAGGRSLSFASAAGSGGGGTGASSSSARGGGGGGAATALQSRGTQPPPPPEETGVLAESRKHAAAITSIVRTDVCVFSASLDWQIIRWCVFAPFAAEGCVGSHSLAVRCLLVTPRYLVSAGDDAEVKLWPFQPLDKPATLAEHGTAVTALCYHQGLLWTGADDGNIRLWNLEGNKKCVQVLTPHTTQVTTITPLDNTMYTCDKAGNILVWDLTNASQLTQRIPLAEQSEVFAIGGGNAPQSPPLPPQSPVEAVVGVELLHCFRAPIPKVVKASAATLPQVAQQRGTTRAPSADRGANAGAARARLASSRPTQNGSSAPQHSGGTAYIHDVKLVANVKGVLAWMVTTDGCKMAFLPHRPIEEELERKLGPMGDLGDSDCGDSDVLGSDDALGGEDALGRRVFTRDEILEMQRQLCAFEEREAEQYEQLQEVQSQLEDFAAFTNVVTEDVLVQSLELFEEHRARVERLFRASQTAIGEQVGKEVSKAMERIASLEAALADRDAKLAEKSKLLTSINAKHATQAAAKSDEIAKLATELSKAQHELRQSQFELRHCRDALAISEATVKRQESKMDKSQLDAREVALLKLELKRTKEQLESFQTTADRHVQRAKKHTQDAAQRVASDLQEELAAMETERDNAVAALREATEKLGRASLDALAMQADNKNLRSELATLRQSLDRRSASRARSESLISSGAKEASALAASLGSEAVAVLRQSVDLNSAGEGDASLAVLEHVIAWREHRDMPPLDIAAQLAQCDADAPPQEKFNSVKILCWPSLAEMFEELRAEAAALQGDVAAHSRRCEELSRERDEKAADAERARQAVADERSRITKLQESVEALKRRAAAASRATSDAGGSATATPQPQPLEPPPMRQQPLVPVLVPVQPPPPASPPPPTPRSSAPPTPQQLPAAAPSPPSSRTPSAATTGVDSVISAALQNPDAVAVQQPVPQRAPTLEELAAGDAAPPPVTAVAAAVVKQPPVEQPPTPTIVYVSRPTKSIFANPALPVAAPANSTPNALSVAVDASGQAGHASISLEQLRAMDPADPLFDQLLDAITKHEVSRAPADSASAARAVTSVHGAVVDRPATGAEGGADELDGLVNRIDATKRQLERLERAAESAEATHPALRAGLLREISKLHRQLVGDPATAPDGQSADGFTPRLERDLGHIVRVAQQHHAVTAQQQQQLLEIIRTQHSQLATLAAQQQQHSSPGQRGASSGGRRSGRTSPPQTYAEQAARRVQLASSTPPNTGHRTRDDRSPQPRPHHLTTSSSALPRQLFPPPPPPAALLAVTPKSQRQTPEQQYELLERSAAFDMRSKSRSPR